LYEGRSRVGASGFLGRAFLGVGMKGMSEGDNVVVVVRKESSWYSRDWVECREDGLWADLMDTGLLLDPEVACDAVLTLL